MRGGHAAPRSFLRSRHTPVVAVPAHDPDATVTFTPDFSDPPAFLRAPRAVEQQPSAGYHPGRTVTVDLRGAGAWVTRHAPEPPPPPVPFTRDYHGLPHFRATLRVAGWCGLAMRKGGAQ
ncbi:MAG TPA: hypothetical protein VHZ03_14170 [Trebonia sp.]|jgi:hypothetical protein|nr:hypothetical protein [Trebonia sp.]